ncbi:ionotropic receptor 75a-like [Phymastichus coffea]|uniref:ionotropic receptor 75a-like n=1 Tax=Phymastichus coffea TaxID=108790 RepID=UPI00273A83A8|nr:ionotropic receptor 75a-like [Phymastichus coffea]
MSLMDYFHEYRDITRDARLKFGFFILSHLSNLLNFSIEYVQAGEWAHGDGLGPTVRALMNSSIDLTGTPGNMNTERLSLIKFIHQGWPFRTCFIFRNPQPKTIKAEELLRPFVHGVWCLVGLFLLTSMAILALTSKWDRRDGELACIANAFTMTLGALCQQGTEIQMPRLSTRVAFLSVLIFSLLVYNYYSACVVSARLDEPIVKISDSLEELGKLHLRMASERMFYLSFYFASPDKQTKKFHEQYWFKIPEAQQFLDPDVAIELVRRGHLAYHVHPDVAYALIEKHYDNREICELMEVHWGRPIDTMFAATKNCTFEEILKIGFIKITEVGLRYRQLRRWQYRKPVCRKDILNASSINMYEFATHLILLAAGALLALVVYGLELVLFDRTIILPAEFREQRARWIRHRDSLL